jgi:hypothetical protein
MNKKHYHTSLFHLLRGDWEDRLCSRRHMATSML